MESKLKLIIKRLRELTQMSKPFTHVRLADAQSEIDMLLPEIERAIMKAGTTEIDYFETELTDISEVVSTHIRFLQRFDQLFQSVREVSQFAQASREKYAHMLVDVETVLAHADELIVAIHDSALPHTHVVDVKTMLKRQVLDAAETVKREEALEVLIRVQAAITVVVCRTSQRVPTTGA